MSELRFNEETLRDGQQSLWANRMPTRSMLPIAPTMDEAGFSSINIMSGSAFETCVLYLNEDPWERLHLLGQLMPKTDLQILIRGRSAFGWRRFPNDAIELLIKCLKNTGIQGIVVFDGLNDISNIEWHIHVAKEIGLQIHPALVFAKSPVHTDEYYASKAKECVKLGTDSVNLADASGLLTPERVRTLIPAIRKAIGDGTEFGFVSHDGTGLATACYLEAMQLGIDNISTASLPLSFGNSIPSTEEIISYAREMGYDVKIDDQLRKKIDDHFFWVAYQENKPVGQRVRFNPSKWKKYAEHQIPGGMMSHLGSQLKNLGLENRLPELLEEAGRVRQEIGYPVMVTPFSQIVGVQAVFNVIEGERYKTVPSDLCQYARGYYGKPAAPVDPNILDRILEGEDKEPIDPAENFSDPLVSRVRAETGVYRSDEKLLLELFFSRPTLEKFYQNKKAIEFPVMRLPLAALIEELAKRRDVRKVSVQRGSLKMEQIF
ncbi:MAG: pyruvate carboxylase subunit B [Thermodesulfobacteriota bacterium]|nr:pyruvate carboxylase subunit B [Thermodesulfobacteriota bacterium]